jgi:hypothetical protein
MEFHWVDCYSLPHYFTQYLTVEGTCKINEEFSILPELNHEEFLTRIDHLGLLGFIFIIPLS